CPLPLMLVATLPLSLGKWPKSVIAPLLYSKASRLRTQSRVGLSIPESPTTTPLSLTASPSLKLHEVEESVPRSVNEAVLAEYRKPWTRSLPCDEPTTRAGPVRLMPSAPLWVSPGRVPMEVTVPPE